jgi:voltage-gated potassium channel
MSDSENKNTKILQILFIVIAVIIIGTFGYYFIEEGWTLFESFYMTMITISTVGYGETKDLGLYGRIFTVILICVGIGVVAMSASQLASFIIGREIKNIFGKEKLYKQLEKIRDHYIICGYNKISRGICQKFTEENVSFVVVDFGNEQAETLNDLNKILYIKADPTKNSTLKKIKIEEAKGLIACNDSDSNNLYIALAARELNPDINIIVRGFDPKIEDRLIRAGADNVVYPLKLGGEEVASIIYQNSIKDKDTGNRKKEITQSDVHGFYLEFYRYFEDENTTIDSIVKRTSAIRAVALRVSNEEIIENPPKNSIVSNNDSVILVKNINIENHSKHEVLTWSSEMSVGIVSFDKEHKHLVDLINKIELSIKNRDTRNVIFQVFEEIFEYVLVHFEHEEELFEKYEYPELLEHKRIHKEILEKVKDLDKQKNVISPDSLIAFLKSWIKHHIMEEDMKYTAYLLGKGAE